MQTNLILAHQDKNEYDKIMDIISNDKKEIHTNSLFNNTTDRIIRTFNENNNLKKQIELFQENFEEISENIIFVDDITNETVTDYLNFYSGVDLDFVNNEIIIDSLVYTFKKYNFYREIEKKSIQDTSLIIKKILHRINYYSTEIINKLLLLFSLTFSPIIDELSTDKNIQYFQDTVVINKILKLIMERKKIYNRVRIHEHIEIFEKRYNYNLYNCLDELLQVVNDDKNDDGYIINKKYLVQRKLDYINGIIALFVTETSIYSDVSGVIVSYL